MNHPRILRERQADTREVIDRLVPAPDDGSIGLLAQTQTVASYPTTAQAFYACQPQAVDGPEIEGASALFVPSSSRVVYAFNIGSAVPPVGTRVILHACGGRWVFRYDG